MYEAASLRVGASTLAVDLVEKNDFTHSFNPAGGFHHARSNRAAGFCIFNDVAIAARYAQKKYGLKKIAIIDIDGHHADGTQEIFYKEKVLTISFHRYGFWFYPGTGWIDEIGSGEGKGYSVNVPLPAGTCDETFLYAYREVVPPLIRSYKPELIIHQFGVDGHYGDPLVGLRVTTKGYSEIASLTHGLCHEVCDGKYVILGGGGYDAEASARCWAIMVVNISQTMHVSKEEYIRLFDKISATRNEKIHQKVKEIVDRLKKIVFPYHGLEPS